MHGLIFDNYVWNICIRLQEVCRPLVGQLVVVGGAGINMPKGWRC